MSRKTTHFPSPSRGAWRSKAIFASVAIVAVLVAWGAWSTAQSPAIGLPAFDHTKALVGFGPRPVGSAAHGRMEGYITAQLQAAGIAVEQDSFTAQTPSGSMKMTNIIGRLGKPGGRIIVLSTHYDTKLIKDFVGANDGGSSTGLVLALAPILAKRSFNHEIRLVFFDGEEAINFDWTDADSAYGSKHLAAKWKADGTATRIGAFILTDMIGDADLNLYRDSNSTPWLRDLIWNIAGRLGHSHEFLNREAGYDDDHIPFVKAGVPAVDLLDLDFGPGNRYWHTTEDTLDKVSARSLQTVGEVVLEAIIEIDRQR